jgi:hypothetical protein
MLPLDKQTSAGKTYSKSMALWMSLYVVGLFGSIWIIQTYNPALMVKYALALAPALPIGGSIVAIMRFMRDSDEYIRAVHAERFILTTGIVLFGCTVWGFMQNFADAPKIDLWIIYPVFWAIFGLISCLPSKKT